jgi:hypothetical protein
MKAHQPLLHRDGNSEAFGLELSTMKKYGSTSWSQAFIVQRGR